MTPRDYLAGLEFFGIKLGLDNIRALLDRLGNPQRACPVVHIAGTNGKGSVVAFLDSIGRAAGYRVGRFTSPHLIDVSERFTINGAPISDESLDREIEALRALAETFESPPTYFEMCTAIAFRWFAAEQVDLAIIEVGMGGRLDATNVVEPVATAITNIDLEHTRHLGDTIEAIAVEKAGILKPGVPVVVGEMDSAAQHVITDRANLLGCPVSMAGRDYGYTIEGEPLAPRFSFDSETRQLGPVTLGIAGGYQGANAAMAVALADQLSGWFPRLNDATVMQGLTEARWPCRLERVLDDPPVIIDVAHNTAGMRRLAESISNSVVVLAVAEDKDAAGMIDSIAPVANRLILTQFDGNRALRVEDLSTAAGGWPHEICDTLEEAIDHGMTLASADRSLVITGSIFTAGQARRLLVTRYDAPALRF